MRTLYRLLGRWLLRHRNAVLAAWLVVLCIAGVFASRGPRLLDAGSRPLSNTQSAEVERILANDFANPYSQNLAVIFHSKTGHYADADFQRNASILLERLKECRGVSRSVLPDARFGSRFRSGDGHGIVLLVGLNAHSVSEAEKFVPGVRECVNTTLAAAGLSGWEWQTTGQSALISDLNSYNEIDSQRAERRALPLTLIVLVLVFGSLASAGLPLVLGVASTLLALGVVPVFAHFGPINVLYQNVVTLLGLALGIDYSLFIVSRYREQIGVLHRSPEDALVETLATTGVSVTYSGLSVLIGLVGLLFTPLFELRSMGLGGMTVVAMSLALSLTLLPALLDLVHPWLDAPKRLSSWLRISGSERRWSKWMDFVLCRPVWSLAAGLVFLLLISAPLLKIHPGFPNKSWYPEDTETARGFSALRAMSQGQELFPLNLIVRTTDGTAVLPDHVDQFFALSQIIKSDSRVESIYGPVDLGDDLQEFQIRTLYLNFEQTLENHPELEELLLSRKHDQALVQVILKDSTGYNESLACARDLARISLPGLSILAGGQWVYSNDFDRVLLKAYPRVFAFVVVTTFLILLLAFRSFLVPIKALILNSLSVTAAFGATVAVFQWGWGIRLFGLTEAIGSIPLNIPLIVFCVTFGLSMDYEVLILARVREEYLQDRDNEQSVRRGLVATGGLVSGAAAIMIVVFGAFSLADIVLVKMLGFGLAIAVLVDAIIVRSILVPAAMKLAGRWNWYPALR